MKSKNDILNDSEKKSLELIQTIGDITVKSILNYENVTIVKGIEQLSHIAKTFLDLKHKNKEKYKVNQEIIFTQTKLKNQYITYIVNEFERIFNTSIEKHNTNANKLLIFKLTEILDKTMKDENNRDIFKQLIDTRNYFGSAYWKMFQNAIRNDAHNEKLLLSQSLITIPQNTILNNKYHLQYVDQFLSYHLFRVLKLIIENDDFESFKNIVNNYAMAITIDNPEKICEYIKFDLYFYDIVCDDKVLVEKRSEIMFLLKFKIIKNYNIFPEIFQTLDDYKTLLLKKHLINHSILTGLVLFLIKSYLKLLNFMF